MDSMPLLNRQPLLHSTSGTEASAGGFTLLELLIVLTILVTVTGMTLPAIRGSLDKSRLTSAAKDVQAALGKTRALAIREGSAMQFRFETGGGRFVIERPAPAAAHSIVLAGATGEVAETTSGLNAETPDPAATTGSQTAPGEDLASSQQAIVMRKGSLPDGVIFEPEIGGDLSLVTGTSGESGAGTFQSGVSAAGNVGSTEMDGTVSGPMWSAPIVFHPSGRTQSRILRLRGQRDFVIDVSLRGLTAAASCGAPQRLSSDVAATAPGDDSVDRLAAGAAP